MVNKKKVRRVVLGVGHPWFERNKTPSTGYHSVRLYPKDGAKARPFSVIELEIQGLGGYNKIRLVAEIIK